MPKPLPEALADFTNDLMGDLRDLRSGKITERQGRVRALLAREILRGVNLQLEGMKIFSSRARAIDRPKDVT